MANTNAPFGFIPTRADDGENKLNGYGRYALASGYNTKIVRGEVVISSGALNSTDPTRLNVARGAGSSELAVGVAWSFSYTDASGNYHQGVDEWPASTTLLTGTVCVVNVLDDPRQEFIVQGENAAWVVADGGLNADYTPGTAGTTGPWKGRSVLTRTGIATTATVMCRLLGLAPVNLHVAGPNDIGAYCRWRVRLNAHFHGGTTGV